MLAERIGRLKLTHDYDFEGMPDLSEWYGTDLRTFMLTHMGYRFVVRGVKFGSAAVEVTVENTGFGHLLMRPHGEIKAGAASHSVDIDLRKIRPGERKAFALPLPKGASASSAVFLTVRLDTPAAQVVHFANDAMREGDSLRLR